MFHLWKSVLAALRTVYSLKSLLIREIVYYTLGNSLFQNLIHKFFPSYQIFNQVNSTIKLLDQQERAPSQIDVDLNEILNLEHPLRAAKMSDKLSELMRRRIGLQFRLGGGKGGQDPRSLGYVEYGLLVKWAESWKKEQDIYFDKSLTKAEKKHLKYAARYTLFVDLLLEDKDLRDKFFFWTLQDGNSPEIFIEFPSLTEWIIQSDLSRRLGKFDGLIQIEETNGVKDVTLLFEGKPVSILDTEREIEFRGSYTRTVAEVFEVFRCKYKEVGDFEIFEDGVISWNTFKMGYWDDSLQEYILADFLSDNWWKDLPHFETLTHEEVEKRYEVAIDGVSWVSAVTATRGNINLSYEKTHAFIELAIPDGRGRYQIYNFGKYGRDFPKNMWDGLKKFTLTMLANVMYPDENVYYSHRQRGYYPFVISPEKGRMILNLIRHEIFRCMAGKSVYQIESDNCAKWTVDILTDALGPDNIPNLYKMSLLDCEPGGPMQKLFNLIKKLPKFLHAFAITRLHYPIGAWRGVWVKHTYGKEWKSLSSHQFFNTAEVYLPALVIKKRDEGLFDIQTANLDGQTRWSLVVEKVLHRVCLFYTLFKRWKLLLNLIKKIFDAKGEAEPQQSGGMLEPLNTS